VRVERVRASFNRNELAVTNNVLIQIPNNIIIGLSFPKQAMGSINMLQINATI
jgi:hypothetical protein